MSLCAARKKACKINLSGTTCVNTNLVARGKRQKNNLHDGIGCFSFDSIFKIKPYDLQP